MVLSQSFRILSAWSSGSIVCGHGEAKEFRGGRIWQSEVAYRMVARKWRRENRQEGLGASSSSGARPGPALHSSALPSAPLSNAISYPVESELSCPATSQEPCSWNLSMSLQKTLRYNTSYYYLFYYDRWKIRKQAVIVVSKAELFLPLGSSLLISGVLVFRPPLILRPLWLASLWQKLFQSLVQGCLSYSGVGNLSLFILCMYVHMWGCMCAWCVVLLLVYRGWHSL